MEKRKDSLIRKIAVYYSSNVYRQFLGIFTAYIKPKFLSPELFGLWNILNLIPAYASYAHLGSRDSMRYSIPYHEVQDEKEKNSAIKGSVLSGFPIMVFDLLIILNITSGRIVIERVSSLNSIDIVFYISDHGLALFDGDDVFGGLKRRVTTYDVSIPLIVLTIVHLNNLFKLYQRMKKDE